MEDRGVIWKFSCTGTERTRRCGRGEGADDISGKRRQIVETIWEANKRWLNVCNFRSERANLSFSLGKSVNLVRRSSRLHPGVVRVSPKRIIIASSDREYLLIRRPAESAWSVCLSATVSNAGE